jgi:hypothetical protein
MTDEIIFKTNIYKSKVKSDNLRKCYIDSIKKKNIKSILIEIDGKELSLFQSIFFIVENAKRPNKKKGVKQNV